LLAVAIGCLDLPCGHIPFGRRIGTFVPVRRHPQVQGGGELEFQGIRRGIHHGVLAADVVVNLVVTNIAAAPAAPQNLFQTAESLM